MEGLDGARVREAREALGLSQTQAAAKAGLHTSQLSSIELGHRQPRTDALARLARALEVSADWLLGLSDNPRPRRR